jgi:hypothetical protein
MEEHQMHKLAFIAGALAILSTPALAAGDKPMVVAEEGRVSVSIGDRDHDRDRDRDRHHKVVVVGNHEEHHHHVVVVRHHHDEDHHRIVLVRHHHDHDEGHGDHDRR